jgi:hypothetical protein
MFKLFKWFKSKLLRALGAVMEKLRGDGKLPEDGKDR